MTKKGTLEDKLSFMQRYVIKNAVKRAVKAGVIEQETDLINEPSLAKKIAKHEREYIGEKILAPATIVGTGISVIATAMMKELATVKRRVEDYVIPGDPEHTEIIRKAELSTRVCEDLHGDPKTCIDFDYHREEVIVPTEDRYYPEYETSVNNPELLSAAILLPFVAYTCLKGREAYWWYAEKNVTSKNIKKFIKNRGK